MEGVQELKELDLFSTCSEEQLQGISGIANRRLYKAGAHIYAQGESAREIFIVVQGLVSLQAFKPEDGLVIAFEVCEPGDLFGASSLMDGHVYTLTAVCLENTAVLVVDAEKLSQLCEIDFELGYRLMKKIAQRYFIRYEIAKQELGFPVAAGKTLPS